MFDGSIHYGLHTEEPEIKPHGRKAWLLIMGNGAAFDISVMPKLGEYGHNRSEEEFRFAL